ncbi:leucine-rich repeat protein [Aspergillus coremiiformis]|uniref:Leucine-rich repeat protein n=1 Tax=Aspergillus coremiiformis TaxID=138285 RepID=A0A5N6ZIG1_9EURO|nr:leucine-rich repeat protein [Aspergillus coremiiformis]
MSNQPWLDNLSDDWVSVPGTPASPVPTRSANHSRRTSLQSLQGLPNSPSRIPVPARRSVGPSPAEKKKVSRPCHFVKREPPTPKTPRTPRTPSKLRSPAPDKTKKIAKLDPPSSRKQKPAMDTRSPLRSVSNASTQSGQQSTVQVRPKKGKDKEGTPEWRKRLVRGEIPTGEQRDLFAPIGLEGVFKPPTPGSEKAQHEAIPKMKQRDELWDFGPPSDKDHNTSSKRPSRAQNNIDNDVAKASTDEGQAHSAPSFQSQETAEPSGSPQGSPNITLEPRKDSDETYLERNHCSVVAQDETQMRSASGLEDLRNEGITPITFTRNNTVEGNATSEVIRSALQQVTSKLQKLSLPPYERSDSRASDSILLNQQAEFTIDPPSDEDIFDVTSHSLPKDLSMGTLDYRGLGAFAKLRREPYLNESSFHRQLSPPTFPSQRLSPFFSANSRIRSSPPFYNRTNPMIEPPTLPRPSSAHVKAPKPGEDKYEAMPSSGSPLKLFGNHDTFTNNKLLRRMSQFEETFGELSEEDEPASPSEEARQKGESRSFLGVRHDTLGDNSLRRVERPRSRNTANSRISRFGNGQLDNFDFADTSPYEPKLLNSDVHDEEVRPPSRRRRYLRHPSHRDPSRRSEFTDANSTGKSSNMKRGFNSSKNQGPFQLAGSEHEEPEWNPLSPMKDPNPKRRRTFMRSHILAQEDQDEGVQGGQSVKNLSLLQRSLMQHGLRYDNDNLLRPQSSQRPKTPTPSQTRSSSTRKRSWPSKNEPDVMYNDENSSPEANVPIVKITGVHEEIRKGSITTQDFLNEATKIMDIIRSKGRAVGGLSSVEESEVEDKNESESYEDESTREEFSRPPSREGFVDMRKMREPKEPNPRILSHLKKFQEHDELEFGGNASVTSLDFDNKHVSRSKLGKVKDNLEPKGHGAANQASENMQAEDDVFEQRERKSSATTSGEDDDLPDLLTFNTQISSKSLSARSVPTGSSQSSHAKGVLSSDLVSHLIPEQVNGLTYDRYKHQWIRERSEVPFEKPRGEDSEDDPFRDIPDLSVDELQEMMRMENSPSPERTVLIEGDKNQSPLSRQTRSPSLMVRPKTKDGEPSVAANSLQSKVTRSTSSIPNSTTRVTSWGSEVQGKRASSSEVEHEILLHEGRLSKPPRRQRDGKQQARVVTISFSSPLVSQIAYSDNESPSKLRRAQLAGSEQKTETSASRTYTSDQPSSPHAICRMDERDKDPGCGLSLVRRGEDAVSTPLKSHPEKSLMCLRDTGDDTSYSFHLSPLPDFTVHQIDQSLELELSYVAQRTHPTSLRQVHGTFALATEELVKHITAVEPFEPYWDHVRRLVLRQKGLITLHKLCDFCPRLEELDVSNNSIGQLSGVPSTLRTLRIAHNCLSNLTSWGHLVNLQYLDVSGNELESLDGFGSLIHLRELKADDNNIRSIDGIFELDGLLSLKLRNNCLTTVDFEGSELIRLQELDISHNQLMSIRNLESLSALSTLDLSFNQLARVAPSVSMPYLSALRLSNNQLHSLDVEAFPSLTLLYLDHNYLFTVSGLAQCPDLEVFSAREQMNTADHNGGFFDVDLGLVRDVRKVFLSSNKLSLQCLSPSTPLLGLQLLDLASCNIQSLPVDFALNFPNVRVLNLNFNSLAGISELAGLNCLSRLAIAGNCIVRLRRLCQVLSRIGRTNRPKVSTLQKVDVRGNPLTVRFYPPAVTGSGKVGEMKNPRVEDEHSQAEQVGLDIQSVLAEFGHAENLERSIFDGQYDDGPCEKDIKINDPYTLPPADPQADQKYLSHLDDQTRLRRKVFELMLYAGTGGSLKFLDGLQLRPTLEPGSDMDHAWKKLEELGVLKRKAITG